MLSCLPTPEPGTAETPSSGMGVAGLPRLRDLVSFEQEGCRPGSPGGWCLSSGRWSHAGQMWVHPRARRAEMEGIFPPDLQVRERRGGSRDTAGDISS